MLIGFILKVKVFVGLVLDIATIIWGPKSEGIQKIGHKGQNLGDFCFLQMGDQYRFQGPGLWTTQGWRVSGYVARGRLWWWICGEGASSVTDGLLVIGLSH